MTLTPYQRELMEVMVEVLLEDPRFLHALRHGFAKARFERVNCRYLGLCGEDCSCQK